MSVSGSTSGPRTAICSRDSPESSTGCHAPRDGPWGCATSGGDHRDTSSTALGPWTSPARSSPNYHSMSLAKVTSVVSLDLDSYPTTLIEEDQDEVVK